MGDDERTMKLPSECWEVIEHLLDGGDASHFARGTETYGYMQLALAKIRGEDMDDEEDAKSPIDCWVCGKTPHMVAYGRYQAVTCCFTGPHRETHEDATEAWNDGSIARAMAPSVSSSYLEGIADALIELLLVMTRTGGDLALFYKANTADVAHLKGRMVALALAYAEQERDQ